MNQPIIRSLKWTWHLATSHRRSFHLGTAATSDTHLSCCGKILSLPLWNLKVADALQEHVCYIIYLTFKQQREVTFDTSICRRTSQPHLHVLQRCF